MSLHYQHNGSNLPKGISVDKVIGELGQAQNKANMLNIFTLGMASPEELNTARASFNICMCDQGKQVLKSDMNCMTHI